MSGDNAWYARGDEYVDGLRVKRDAPGFRAQQTTYAGIPFPPRDGNTYPLKRLRSRLTWRRGCGILIGVALLSCVVCCGGLLHVTPRTTQETSTEVVEPQPAVTVTVTVTTTTAPTIPESCKQAIQQALAALDSASRISSVSGTQLDILSKATQAILNKDQALMNEAASEQRRLESSTMHDAAGVQVPYQQIKDGLATCP